jgi:osmotically-inducible protein OsmY
MIATGQVRAVTDHLLASRISTQLAETHRWSLKRLSVDVCGGEVTLRGCVGSFYEKQIAIQTCRGLAGIERLTDAMEVAEEE